MRRFIVLTTLIILMSHVTHAQELRRFEIGISGGGPGWMIGFVGGAESHFSLIGEFKYTPVKWISLGLMGGIHDRQPGQDDYSPEEHNPGASTSYDCNLMLMLYGNWFTRERINIYSGVGYGTMGGYVNGDGRPSHGFQFTPIGVSYGKRFFGFAELGTGWMFFPVRAGIGYRF